MSAERIWELIARKLAGEASAEELSELDQLLRNHADLHFPVQTINDLWLQPRNTEEPDYAQNAWDEHLNRMQTKGISIGQTASESDDSSTSAGNKGPAGARRRIRRFVAAAVIILVGFFATYFFLPEKPAPALAANDIPTEPANEIFTQYGTRTTRQLPDGSRVWLNAGSKLIIDTQFNESVREVTLTGEAFFDVVKNAGKPFIIHTPTIDIKVLGTQFNVKSYPADKTTETSLLRGSVEVVVKNRPAEKYVLKPNEKLVVLNEEVINLNKNGITPRDRSFKESIIAIKNLTYQQGDTSAIEAAWIRNKLSVKDEPFIELAKKMERWYNVRFEFRNKNLEEVWITGSFENETLEQALEALQFSIAFRFELNDKTVIVY